jgi:hypothetical protein
MRHREEELSLPLRLLSGPLPLLTFDVSSVEKVQQIPGKVTEPGPKEEAGLLAADDLGAHLLPAAAAPRRHLHLGTLLLEPLEESSEGR